MGSFDVVLPLAAGECPLCHGAVDGISFGEAVPSPSRLTPCGHYVDVEDARELVDQDF